LRNAPGNAVLDRTPPCIRERRGFASAAGVFTYQGPDELTIVGRPNAAGTNVRGAHVHARALPAGRVGELLAPAVAAALQGCAMDDVRGIVISPEPMRDRIGETFTRIGGLGLYLNLPLASRVYIGNFYLAPFFAGKISLLGDAGTLQSAELFEFSRTIVENPQLTEEGFLDARTADIEETLAIFLKARMPAAIRKALGSRCPG
jgi:hypothetical protein